MTFESDGHAHRFYNEYSAIARFSIQKAANYHCQKKDAHNNKITRFALKCNRSGKLRNRTKPTTTGGKGESTKVIRMHLLCLRIQQTEEGITQSKRVVRLKWLLPGNLS